MAELATIATLWIGGSLSWLEQLCLKSFVDAGHPVVLYSYEDVEGMPDGVERRDGRDILEGKPIYTHKRKGSVAPFADIFRFHMMQKAPGQIWVDTDVYCWKPLTAETDRVFGFEKGRRINSAVLRLPPDSEALGQFLEFMEDEYPIPPFGPSSFRAKYREAAEAGNPIHVSDMIWGLWGPVGLTHFLQTTGEAKFAKPVSVYYPVQYMHRNIFFKKAKKVLPMIKAETETVHLWSPIKRFAASRFGGYAPHTSFLWSLLRKHGLDPKSGRIMKYGGHEYDYTKYDITVEHSPVRAAAAAAASNKALALAKAEATANQKVEALALAEVEVKEKAEALAKAKVEARETAEALARAKVEAQETAEAQAKVEVETKALIEAKVKAALEAKEKAKVEAVAEVTESPQT